MSKKCDHKSVGILVWKDTRLLLIERKKLPFGLAPPAGHVDCDTSFEDAAGRELKEEVGLDVRNLKLIAEGRKNNICRRPEGVWHFWKIYEADVSGRVVASKEETKAFGWYSARQMSYLTKRTEPYLAGLISEEEWQKNPGLEPVWHEWFKKLKPVLEIRFQVALRKAHY